MGRARANLGTIFALTERLDTEAQMGRQALHIHAGIPGGDALVLAAPGNYHPGWAAVEELPNDPRPPLVVLSYWSDLWRDHASQPTDLAPTLDRTVDYLHGQLHRIANTELFPALSADLARVVRQLEDVLHEGVRPETTRVPCLNCGVRLVRVYADQAAGDHWACPRCGDRYDRPRFERAKHHHLASTGAERFVPVSDAVAVTGRPEQTIRAWIRSDLIDARRHPATGRLEVWWPDVRARHLTTPTRRRQR